MEKNSLIFRIKEGLQDMCYIWAKEMRSTFKDEGVLIFFIFVPLLYPLLYSWIYNNETVREVPVAVIDMSHSNLSRTFIRHYDATPDVQVKYFCNSLDEAKVLIGKQVVKGVVYIPNDFESKVIRHEQTAVDIYCDMSIMLYYKCIYQSATGVIGDMNSQIQIAQSGDFTQRDDEITVKPLDFDEIAIFNGNGGYADFLIPGVLILILHQTLLLGIGLSAGTARENNRYKDLVPVSRHYNGLFRIVLGKSLCYFMIYMVMAAYILIVVPRIFGLLHIAQFRLLIAFIVPFLLATVFFGMMISCVVRYRENVILLVVFTSVPFLFLSGISWPQSNIPSSWEAIAWLFPSTFGIRGYVRLNSMGASLPDIKGEYQALWIQTTVYFFATCLVYRAQLINTRRHAIERINMMKQKLNDRRAKNLNNANQPDTAE
jgi:ABC-2 type transport system permease protein